jgi:pimeloyl-ACP methyl ester carboxylesterase
MIKLVLAAVAVLVGLALVGALIEVLAEARDRRLNPPPGRLVDVGGRRLHILCKGDAPGPTVVVEQGFAEPAVIWRAVQDKVGAFARICIYDRAGYEWSDPGPSTRSLADRARDLHELLHRGGIPGPYILVGHSFGGPLIRMFANDHPDEVAGMVLVDTPDEAVIFRDSYARYVRQIGGMAKAWSAAARIGVVRLMMNLLSKPDEAISPETNRQMIAFMSRPDFMAQAEDETGSLLRAHDEVQRPGGFGALGEKPLIVITHGKPFTGPPSVLEPGWAEGQHRLAALSSDSELIVATKSGHMIFAEEPQLIVDAIRRVHAAARDHSRLDGKPHAATAAPVA